jgi:UDP-N-acetylmuramate: L-alanyl-gamma-D-glutamyl-meso-diaminopimelate ligase
VEFEKLLSQVQHTLVTNTDYPAINQLVKDHNQSSHLHIFTYGQHNSQGPLILKTTPQFTRFQLVIDNQPFIFETNLTGPQNILNLTSVILFALSQGISATTLAPHLMNFQMVKRRQEVLGFYKNVLFIDDFAHHPRAVSLTLQGLKAQYPDQKILVIFEPASATARSSVFQKEFTEALQFCDGLLFLRPSRKAQIQGHHDLDGESILQSLTPEKKILSHFIENIDELIKVLDDYLDHPPLPFQLVVTLSNGNLSRLWNHIFPQRISPLPPHS